MRNDDERKPKKTQAIKTDWIKTLTTEVGGNQVLVEKEIRIDPNLGPGQIVEINGVIYVSNVKIPL